MHVHWPACAWLGRLLSGTPVKLVEAHQLDLYDMGEQKVTFKSYLTIAILWF